MKMCCDCMSTCVNVNMPILVIAIDGRGLLENFIEKDSGDIRGRKWFDCRCTKFKVFGLDGCCIDMWYSICLLYTSDAADDP